MAENSIFCPDFESRGFPRRAKSLRGSFPLAKSSGKPSSVALRQSSWHTTSLGGPQSIGCRHPGHAGPNPSWATLENHRPGSCHSIIQTFAKVLSTKSENCRRTLTITSAGWRACLALSDPQISQIGTDGEDGISARISRIFTNGRRPSAF